VDSTEESKNQTTNYRSSTYLS